MAFPPRPPYHILELTVTVVLDNLHGDWIISEYAPTGETSETVFAVKGNQGVKVGTAITLFVAKKVPEPVIVRYRDMNELRAVSEAYPAWPLLPDLFPASFPGVKTRRDDVVVDINRDRLV